LSGSEGTGRDRLMRALIAAFRRPVDLQSEAGRAEQRDRVIGLTALASGLARAISILTTLAAVPLTLHYLGVERYGMWMTLSAFSALLSFADFGIGNSVLTAVARSSGRSDAADLRRQVSSAYAAMSAIALALLALLALGFPMVAWERLFNVASPLAVAEAGSATAVFFVILALSIPLGLVARVQLGLQDGVRANLWQGGASLAALGALLLAIRLEASLPWLVAALAGTPLLVNLINALDYFTRQRPELRPRLSAFDRGAIHKLSSDGTLFLVLQVCAAVMFQINALIIAQLLGPEAVANYAVPERLFAVLTTIASLILAPLWPAYGEAAARGNVVWLRRTLRRSLIYGIGTIAALSGLLVLTASSLLEWWVGDAVAVPFAVILGLGVWKVIEVGGSAVAMFLNGVNELRVQVVFAVITAAASLGLKLWWTPLFGIAGVIYATILAYAVLTVPFLGMASRRALAGIAARGQPG
jgi:O-antigen/teichoic acid export membrane protein